MSNVHGTGPHNQRPQCELKGPAFARGFRLNVGRFNSMGALKKIDGILKKCGTGHAILLSISSSPSVIDMPSSKPFYIASGNRDQFDFSAAMELLKYNQQGLVKAWMMSNPSRPDQGQIWTHEVSIAPNLLSIDGNVRHMHNISEGLGALQKSCPRPIRTAKNLSDFSQFGALFNDGSCGMDPVPSKSWSTIPLSRMIHKNSTSIGLIAAEDVVACLGKALADPKNTVSDALLFGSTLWGFDKGLRIERCLDYLDGWQINFDISPISARIRTNVENTLRSVG